MNDKEKYSKTQTKKQGGIKIRKLSLPIVVFGSLFVDFILSGDIPIYALLEGQGLLIAQICIGVSLIIAIILALSKKAAKTQFTNLDKNYNEKSLQCREHNHKELEYMTKDCFEHNHNKQEEILEDKYSLSKQKKKNKEYYTEDETDSVRGLLKNFKEPDIE